MSAYCDKSLNVIPCHSQNIRLSLHQVFLFLFYIPALSLDPLWIPYAFMASTVASVPLVMVVKEEYNRSRIDQTFGYVQCPLCVSINTCTGWLIILG